jgi:ATP-dependent helicase/nuclease subunit A
MSSGATGRTLVDAEARRRIESDLGSTLFVEAGAGSGKTTALVSRIVSLVREGVAEIQNIAAITFTEAAAAELRLRVRQALQAGATPPSDRAVQLSFESATAATAAAAPTAVLVPPAPSDESRKRCEAALACIDEAPISTIHGFCQRVLAGHPIEAGLPPQIEVMDEMAEDLEWRARWSAELDALAGDGDAAGLVALAWSLGVNAPRLERLARAIERDWHANRPDRPDLAAALARARDRAGSGLAELRAALEVAVAERPSCRDCDDLLAKEIDELERYAGELAAAVSWDEAIPLVVASPINGKRAGQAANWPDVDTVRAVVRRAAEVRASLLADLLDLALHPLVHHLEARSFAAADDRRRRGRLSFHDLLVMARDLLASNAHVLAAVRRRYRYLLVDEFQDTDPLQLEIARLIGTGGGDEVFWEDGRCFFVGDPKQSIYRFRGADVVAYESARDGVVGVSVTRLSSNFRSVAEIISFVNGCFSVLLAERFHPLHAARDEVRPARDPAVAAVTVVGGELDKKLRRAEQRRVEAEDCCLAIERAVVSERWPVADPVTGTVRPARLGDVAILIPRRTGLSELEAALDAHGLGYRVESASLIFKSQEVRDVLGLARALDEPGDDAAVVGTLRSPVYSIGDDELVAWARHGGHWQPDRAATAPEEAVEAAPAVAGALGDLARRRREMAVDGEVGALSRAVNERRLFQLAADRPRAREAWRRMRFILDKARIFVESKGGGLAEFADWVDEQQQGGLRSSESVVPDDDEDVVRIMTVHGAKGLEFPVTVLCGFGTTDSAHDYDVMHRRPGGPTEVHFTTGLRTSGYVILDAEDKRLEDEESLRLLYVAATRARDYLVICGHHVKNHTLTLAERLLGAISCLEPPSRIAVRELASSAGEEENGSDVAGPELVGDRFEVGPGLVPPATAVALGVETLESYDAWRVGRSALLAGAEKPASIHATELAHRAGAPEEPSATAVGDAATSEPGGAEVVSVVQGHARRGRGGTRLGRAVHATLQVVAARDVVVLGAASESETARATAAEARSRLRAIARAEARAEQIEDRADEVARLGEAALVSPVVREAFASNGACRELYTAVKVGGTILDGYVDLCFRDSSGSLVVVDYKTDAVRNEAEAAERARGYELQTAAYALALGEATGWPASRCVLVWLAPPGRPIEHELAGERLRRRIAEVRELIASGP